MTNKVCDNIFFTLILFWQFIFVYNKKKVWVKKNVPIKCDKENCEANTIFTCLFRLSQKMADPPPPSSASWLQLMTLLCYQPITIVFSYQSDNCQKNLAAVPLVMEEEKKKMEITDRNEDNKSEYFSGQK